MSGGGINHKPRTTLEYTPVRAIRITARRTTGYRTVIASMSYGQEKSRESRWEYRKGEGAITVKKSEGPIRY